MELFAEDDLLVIRRQVVPGGHLFVTVFKDGRKSAISTTFVPAVAEKIATPVSTAGVAFVAGEVVVPPVPPTAADLSRDFKVVPTKRDHLEHSFKINAIKVIRSWERGDWDEKTQSYPSAHGYAPGLGFAKRFIEGMSASECAYNENGADVRDIEDRKWLWKLLKDPTTLTEMQQALQPFGYQIVAC